MSARVKVEEIIVDFDGNEKVMKVWPSISECCLDLELDHKTIRQRINGGKGMNMSLGKVMYRRA